MFTDISYQNGEHATGESRGHRYCRFLARYAAVMLGSGATCIRIGKNIKRIAATIGMNAHLITLPHNIIIHLASPDEQESFYYSYPTANVPVSFYINSRLSQLSWAMADGTVDFDLAEKTLCEVVEHKNTSPWIVLLLVSAANASFCRIFGGDWGAMLIVALATAIGYAAKILLLKHKWDVKAVWLICATISSVFAALASYVGTLTSTPDVALATSVLYLIPGIPYINSVSDMLDGHYLSGISRLLHGLILTACIAVGLMAGFLMLNLKVL